MANMSYCRFHNTQLHFAECAGVLHELLDDDAENALSADELRAAQHLVNDAIELIEQVAKAAGLYINLEELHNKAADTLSKCNEAVAFLNSDD